MTFCTWFWPPFLIYYDRILFTRKTYNATIFKNWSQIEQFCNPIWKEQKKNTIKDSKVNQKFEIAKSKYENNLTLQDHFEVKTRSNWTNGLYLFICHLRFFKYAIYRYISKYSDTYRNLYEISVNWLELKISFAILDFSNLTLDSWSATSKTQVQWFKLVSSPVYFLQYKIYRMKRFYTGLGRSWISFERSCE